MSISRLGRNLSIYRLGDLFYKDFYSGYSYPLYENNSSDSIIVNTYVIMATDVLLLWEKSIAREIIALGFFCSNVYCKKNLICRNWKISV